MDKVRLGIIGLGNIGRYHADYLLKDKVARCVLAAVCDSNPAALAAYPACKTFDDGETLIESGEIDAVIIATPHFQHTTLGIAALRAGVHAMVEKPISSHKADAERLIRAHQQHPEPVFAGMFQLRTEPRYLKIRAMIADGDLGEIIRVDWINTDWYRTDAYYCSSGWRATWKGEGGGVLLNQCLHNLDTLQWICGMPARVHGFCQLGRFHNIEVEDQVTAYLEWPGGATGTFIASTGEAPGTNRLEIIGSRGKLVLEDNHIAFLRNERDMLEFSKTSEQGFSKPPAHLEEIPFASADAPHVLMTRNFVAAILDGTPLIAPGEEGIHSVELANAMAYSSFLGQTLALPMDGAAWERKLNQLIAESKLVKKTMAVAAEDFASSFRK
ncbi:MAG TPA: Gfo/Idh/MocA family oxidoreductase [Tepidisphaeraceae bacterium]|nr:Gfo/Idh/MocA family oxidoreductase [Tepidisphaeraceae bacterium]